MIRAFIARNPDLSIRLIAKTENEGYAAALNAILAQASGTFTAFFDDDDTSAPDRLTRQVARIEQYQYAHGTSAIFCYSDRKIVRVGEEAPSHIAQAIGRQTPEPHGPVVADYLLWSRGADGFVWGMFGSCTLMARTELMRRLGGLDPSFRRCAEWDLAIRHAFANGHFIAVDQPLVTQYKTASHDKAGKLPLRYALRLRHKYKGWLRRRHAYWGACLVARSRFYGARGARWTSRFLYMGATVLCPAILRERLGLTKKAGA
jgi:glycosyltransferase involved in cell wall biosynthesis